MTKYFSPSAGGFFDDAIHSPRFIEAVDEEALQAAIATASELGDEDDPEVAAAERVLLLKGDPPTKTVSNEATQIPADAIEITDDRHAELMQELNEGKMPVLDGDQVVAVDRQRPLEEQLADIRSRRDQMLRASDWTQMPDALSAAKRKLWADHRKALRELPAMVEKAVTAGKAPDTVPFPEPPIEKGAKAK